MEKFPEYFESKKRAVPGSPKGFNDLSETVDAPLTKEEVQASSTVDLKLVRHPQSVGGSLLWSEKKHLSRLGVGIQPHSFLDY
eukprot:3023859-Amphidinium_carterae.1